MDRGESGNRSQLNEKDIWLCILIGTSNFTDPNRRSKLIKINYQNTQEKVDHLTDKYRIILKQLSPNSNCSFGEIPFLSIAEWNKKQKEKKIK